MPDASINTRFVVWVVHGPGVLARRLFCSRCLYLLTIAIAVLYQGFPMRLIWIYSVSPLPKLCVLLPSVKCNWGSHFICPRLYLGDMAEYGLMILFS